MVSCIPFTAALCCSFALIASFIAALIIFIPFDSPKLSVDSDTTIISLNFTGNNVTLGGNITAFFQNPHNEVDVFFNTVSVAVYYKVTDNPKAEFLIASTNLPSTNVEGSTNAKYTSSISEAGTTNNTNIGFGLTKFFLRLSASIRFHGGSGPTVAFAFLPYKKHGFLNVSCYPLITQVSTNSTKNATTVLLASISC